MLEERKVKLVLINYFIKHGGFEGLSKREPRLYREILRYKKENASSDITVTQFLERYYLKHRWYPEVFHSAYLKLLFKHYKAHKTLTEVELPTKLETQLNLHAKTLGISSDELKEQLDNHELYPELMLVLKNQYDVAAYNGLLLTIVMSIHEQMASTPAFLEQLKSFNSYAEILKYEPALAKFMQNIVPEHSGNCSDELRVILQGSSYYGPNLNLRGIENFYDDLLYALKSYFNNRNFTPLVSYKVSKIFNVCGNLNRIGFDEFDTLGDLDKLALTLGFESIATMLEAEGYFFDPVTTENYIVKHEKGFEVFLEGEENQILIDKKIKDELEELGEYRLEIFEVENRYKYLIFYYQGEPKPMLCHSILTRRPTANYRGNTLNLLAENVY